MAGVRLAPGHRHGERCFAAARRQVPHDLLSWLYLPVIPVISVTANAPATIIQAVAMRLISVQGHCFRHSITAVRVMPGFPISPRCVRMNQQLRVAGVAGFLGSGHRARQLLASRGFNRAAVDVALAL